MGLLSQLTLWEDTKLDKYIKNLSLFIMGIYCIAGLVLVYTNQSESMLGVIIIGAFLLNLIMDLKYSLSRNGAVNMKYMGETPKEFKKRTGYNYVDNTPKKLTYWKAFKILYYI